MTPADGLRRLISAMMRVVRRTGAGSNTALKKLRDESQKQMETELAALLGEAGFRAYQDFGRTTQVRGFVDGFAVQMATTDPLTPAQAEQLSRALMAASPSFQQGAVADPKARHHGGKLIRRRQWCVGALLGTVGELAEQIHISRTWDVAFGVVLAPTDRLEFDLLPVIR